MSSVHIHSYWLMHGETMIHSRYRLATTIFPLQIFPLHSPCRMIYCYRQLRISPSSSRTKPTADRCTWIAQLKDLIIITLYDYPDLKNFTECYYSYTDSRTQQIAWMPSSDSVNLCIKIKNYILSALCIDLASWASCMVGTILQIYGVSTGVQCMGCRHIAFTHCLMMHPQMHARLLGVCWPVVLDTSILRGPAMQAYSPAWTHALL